MVKKAKKTKARRANRVARRTQSSRTQKPTSASALIKPSRRIKPSTTLFLYTRAGGRCEFDGHNKYLLEHGPTAIPGNFAEQAHIWAFNEGGPRGRGDGRPVDINDLSNLMLLCAECHHLVDVVRPNDFTVDVLRKFKADHEARVYELTGLSKDRDIVPIVMKAQVAGRKMDISDDEMQAAVAPNYLRRRDKIEINLNAIPDRPDDAYWKSACAAIDGAIDQLSRVQPREGRTLRVAVFALAPIPLLVYMGSKLSDKLPVELFQRHRQPETWNWREERGTARFLARQVRMEGDAVALLVNVSGTNTPDQVVDTIGASTVYELTVEGQSTSPLALRTRDDLERFSAEYSQILARIRAAHPTLERMHVFAAVPAPIAVVLGRARLPKVDAAMLIYDRDNRAGGFAPALLIEGLKQ